jgi:hypothetical protein
MECVKSRATRELNGRGLVDGNDGAKAFVAEPLYGWTGPQGYIWTVDIYPDRAEMRWMTKLIDGERDDLLVRIIRECGDG